MSGIIHKVKDAVTHHGSSDQEHHHTDTGSADAYDSAKSSNHGPHDNNIANEADPRVDSDQSQERSDAVGSGRFEQDVHKDSIGGAGVIEGMGGSGGPTTTKTFEQAQHEHV